jgi:hypothetical protein
MPYENGRRVFKSRQDAIKQAEELVRACQASASKTQAQADAAREIIDAPLTMLHKAR